MPKISFTNSRSSLDVEAGANLMDSLTHAGIPVASSCGGSGVCTKCRIQIVAGQQNVSPPNEIEEQMREIHEFESNERMSCQTEVLGDITVHASYW